MDPKLEVIGNNLWADIVRDSLEKIIQYVDWTVLHL